MTELLLEKNLSKSEPGSDVQEVARSQTLTALRLVDTGYKGTDLSDAKLNGANLEGALYT